MTTTLDLINAIEGGKTRDCESTFADLVQSKVANAMAARADEVRASMFESTEVDEEQLDELSKSTLGSYIKRASSAGVHHGRSAGVELGAGASKRKDIYNREEDKAEKRLTGIRKATDRLTKESEE